jgi:hypothetical protein
MDIIMGKKLLGLLLVIMAIFALIGFYLNGAFDKPTSANPFAYAAYYGYLKGVLAAIALLLFSGIFLLSFDRATKLDYLAGFKKRGRQCFFLIFFSMVYGLVVASLAFSIGASLAENGFENAAVSFLPILPYLVPFIGYVAIALKYVKPYRQSKRYFLRKKDARIHYLSDAESYTAVAGRGAVMTSNEALFFPKLFCLIPYDAIASVECKRTLWEQDIYFHLKNGKKFYIVSRHYKQVSAAVNEKKSEVTKG